MLYFFSRHLLILIIYLEVSVIVLYSRTTQPRGKDRSRIGYFYQTNVCLFHYYALWEQVQLSESVVCLHFVARYHQSSSSVSGVFCGPDPSPYVLPHHAGAQSRLECGAVGGRPLHQGLRLGPEAGHGPHSLGRRNWRRCHIRGKCESSTLGLFDWTWVFQL